MKKCEVCGLNHFFEAEKANRIHSLLEEQFRIDEDRISKEMDRFDFDRPEK